MACPLFPSLDADVSLRNFLSSNSSLSFSVGVRPQAALALRSTVNRKAAVRLNQSFPDYAKGISECVLRIVAFLMNTPAIQVDTTLCRQSPAMSSPAATSLHEILGVS